MVKRFVVTTSVIIALLTSPFVVSTIINNARLEQFAKQLFAIPLPPNTEVIETKSLCGRLGGNGNGMDYLAALLVKSSLSLADLTAYYESQEFRVAQTGGQDYTVCVVSATQMDTPVMFLAVPIEFHFVTKTDQINDLYQVMLYDGGYSGAFDLRAH